MTYRDIVLKLLKTRGDLVCVEQHLLSDFSDNGELGDSFLKWCMMHGIEHQKIEAVDPPKIHLKKKFDFIRN